MSRTQETLSRLFTPDNHRDYTFERRFIEKLNKCLSKLLVNDKYLDLVNNVVVRDVISDDPGGNQLNSYSLVYDEQLTLDEYGKSLKMNHKLVITNFGLSDLLKYITCNPRVSHASMATSFSKYLGTPLNDSDVTFRKLCVNICPNMRFRNPGFANLTSVVNSRLLQDICDVKDSLVSEVFFVGTNSVLVGFMCVDGTTYIKWPVLRYLMRSGRSRDVEKVNVLLENILDRITFVHNRLHDIDIKHWEADGKDESICKLIKRLEECKYSPSDADFTLDSEGILKELKRTMATAEWDTIYQSGKSEIYASLLTKVLERASNENRDSSQQSFHRGLTISGLLTKYGWEVATHERFSSNYRSNLLWKKKIDILPDRFFRDGVCKIIPKELRMFRVKWLYINGDGFSFTESTHPNVSSDGSVCLGDLGNIKFSGPTEKIEEHLIKMESLLQILNYDSAYNESYYHKILKVKCKSESEFLKVSKKSSKSKMIAIGAGDLIIDDEKDDNRGLSPSRTINGKDEVEIIKDGKLIDVDVIKEAIDDKIDVEELSVYIRILDQMRNAETVSSSFILNSDRRLTWVHPNGVTVIGVFLPDGSYDSDKPLYFYCKNSYTRPMLFNDPETFEKVIMNLSLLGGDVICGAWGFLSETVRKKFGLLLTPPKKKTKESDIIPKDWEKEAYKNIKDKIVSASDCIQYIDNSPDIRYSTNSTNE